MNADDVKRVAALSGEVLTDEEATRLAEAANKYLWMQAKADWLEYKADGGEDGSLEWLHDNYPGLFAEWQDGVCSGDWLFWSVPGQEGGEQDAR